MYPILARNVNDAFFQGMRLLLHNGIDGTSRNGKVIYIPEPVATTYTRPNERVLFCPERDANPFFHFMEGLWMLDGRRDSAFVSQFNSRMTEYANGEGNFDGAYGDRWRYHFGYDQLMTVTDMLISVPDTRRAVLSMWDGFGDLGRDSLDIPCNTHAYFSRRGKNLNMTVCCRSNDAIWGAYGANAVHMSMLLEVMAAMVGCEVGDYVQFSNNLHVYPEIKNHRKLMGMDPCNDRYKDGLIKFKLVHDPDTWFADLRQFMENPVIFKRSDNPLFYCVAAPMYQAWTAHKEGYPSVALSWCDDIEDQAWSLACRQWIERRAK